MAVSNVYGLEQPFGVSIVAPGTGILLNGALLAFRESTDRVRRNENSERRNELAPGKRMLSPLAPAIVCRDGKLALVVGAASGSASAGVALTLMTNMLDFQMDPASALDAPRWRPRSPGQVLEFEGYSQEAYAGAVRGLHFMGYKLQKNSTSLGDAQAIRVRDGVYFGAADRRIAGAAATPEIGRERAAR
jgi:gamma-glutamyltranspeptidase/glutathione hydrolase